MAKRPPKRYVQGELKHTRSKLGEMSSEEERRMADVLGGEIGIEHPDELTELRYRRLQELNRRKSDRLLPPDKPRPLSFDTRDETHTEPEADDGAKLRYRDRVKMDFLAAKSEFGVKTLSSAYASVFSSVFTIQDYINPKFITRSDDIVFRHIEGLVLSVRGLLALNQKHSVNRLRDPFFAQILVILKNWNIEGLHHEFSHLQIAPRHLTFRHCSTVVKELFDPIVRLMDLAEGNSINRALKRLYDLDILSLPARHPDIDRIKSYYNIAHTELEYVFSVLKRRCYPLLMKSACSTFTAARSFYRARRPEILAFLGLSEEDVVQVPDEVSSPTREDTVDVEEVIQPPDLAPTEMPSLQKGFEILERLFPAAGWKVMDKSPDMYPYFQPLIMFPRGFELVPPEDPLHQIMVLASILQELFYGFRSVNFGTVSIDESGTQDAGKLVNSIIDRWRQFLIELVAQHYLSTLYEYCREVERSPRFPHSTYGGKQEVYLSWLKKMYILPHLVMGRPRPPDVHYSIPKLHMLTTELIDALGAVARELANPETRSPASVKNPWARFSFEIESEVPRRFREVLNLYHEETTNASLLLYTYSILVILDTLLNEKGSHFYPYPNDELYRRENQDSPAPMYTVPVIDPAQHFRHADEKVWVQSTPPIPAEPSPKDTLTGLLSINGLRNRIDQQILIYRRRKAPFVMLSVLIKDFVEFCEREGEEAGIDKLGAASRLIKTTIRDYKDVAARAEDALFLVLLPDTMKDEAVNLAIRVFFGFQERKDPDMTVTIGIVQLEPTWGREKLLRTARTAAKEATKVPPPSLCVYNGKRNRFESLSDVQRAE
jgi:GGDEF domain-containing protein